MAIFEVIPNVAGSESKAMEPCCSKSGVNVIVALPTSLQIELFTKWCKIKDITLLDSALCCQDHRTALLSMWKAPHCTLGHHETQTIDVSEDFANWIACRELKVSCEVNLPEDLSDKVTWHGFFAATRTTLQAIKYPSDFRCQSMSSVDTIASMNYFVDRVATCADLTELTMFRVDPNQVDIRPVLTNCSKLKTLRLLFAYGLDLKSIHELGESIDHLDICFYRPNQGRPSTWEEYVEAKQPIKYTPTSTLRKFQCLFASVDDFQPLITFLWSSTGLRELYIDGVSWSDIAGLLGRCPELTTVRVNDSYADFEMNMDEEIDYVIARARNLRYLQLVLRSRGPLFSERQVLTLLRGCLKLVALVLHDFNTIQWVVDDQPLPLPKDPATPSSSCLQVLHVTAISTPSLREVLALCPHLAELGIAQPEELSHVVDLVVSHNVRRLLIVLPEDSDCALLLPLKNLEALHLSNCTTLTSVQLLQIAKNNPRLSSLVVNDCVSITIDILDDLVSELRELKELVLSDGEDSEREKGLLEELRESCPLLKTARVELSK